LQLSENAEDYRKPKKGLAKHSAAAQRKRCRAASRADASPRSASGLSSFPTISESSRKLLDTTTPLRLAMATSIHCPQRCQLRYAGPPPSCLPPPPFLPLLPLPSLLRSLVRSQARPSLLLSFPVFLSELLLYSLAPRCFFWDHAVQFSSLLNHMRA